MKIRNEWERVDGKLWKICPVCQKRKAEDEYHKDKKQAYGRGSYCIECVRQLRGIKRNYIPKGWSLREGVNGKYCVTCGQWKPETEYHRNKYRPENFHNHCKTCRSLPEYLDDKRRAGREHYRRKYEQIASMGWKCEICGESRFPALDFHHIDPKSKTVGTSIGGMIGRCGMSRIMAEIEKCRCLCANCHRVLHFEEGKAKRIGAGDSPLPLTSKGENHG